MAINTPLFEQIRELVAPLSVEERLAVIRAIVTLEPPIKTEQPSLLERRQKLALEQAAWYALSPAERAHYQAEFVAVQGGQVVDHDPEQRTLYIRVRHRFGHIPVLIVNADWTTPPVYEIHSPHLES